MESELVEAVDRMQAYIDSHLNEPISLTQLARAAGYSPWHAARAFKALVGEPPLNYIRKRRLSEAALRLRDGGRVIDVALDFLFGSQEGFTRAFHRAFGLPPGRYRREAPAAIPLFLPYSARDRWLAAHRDPKEGEKMNLSYFTQVVSFPARTMLIRRGRMAEDYFDYCAEVGCDVWGVLCSVREALNEPMGMWLPDAMIPEGTSRYVQGVQVPEGYAAALPEGYELATFPACQMMVFQSEPYDDALYHEAIGAIWDAIAKYDPAPYGYAWADDEFPRFQMAPEGARGYIEGRPVRAL